MSEEPEVEPEPQPEAEVEPAVEPEVEPEAEVEPAAPAAPTRPLTRDVLRLANRVHALLDDAGRPELARRLHEEAGRWRDTAVSVIVAGSIKRGKSSLLNSAIGHAGLLPVDADVATSIHLVLRHGAELAAEVTRLVDGEPRTQAIPVGELESYASMRGDAALREGVTGVEVAVPHELLERGLQLVDTPGVGGMSRGHRDVTMAALARADALLFTISAQEPVARTELEFLAEASERIDHVLLVVTKADVNTDDANTAMLAEHRDKMVAYHQSLRDAADAGDERARELAERFARFVTAPFLLTSSFLADQAAVREERGRADAAARYRARSGIDQLLRALERSIDIREDLRLANVLQLAALLLADAEHEARGRLRAVEGDRSIEDEVAEQQRVLEEFTSRQARWRSTLANGIQRLQTGAGREVSRELNLVRRHYQQVLEQDVDIDHLTATLPEELERSLHAAWNNLSEQSTRSFGDLVASLLEEFEVEGLETVLGELRMPDGYADVMDRVRGASEAGEFSLLEDGVPLTTQTFLFGNMSSAVLGTLGVASGGLGLVAYGIGAALAAPLTAMRRKQRKRVQTMREYQTIVNEVLFGQEGIAKEFTSELTLRIIDAREQLEALVDGRLVERRKELESRRRELHQLLQSEVKGRAEVQQRAQGLVARIDDLQTEVARAREEVRESVQGSTAAADETGGLAPSQDG